MALDTVELQCKLDQQQTEIKALQDAAEKSKAEFKACLKEETYEEKLLISKTLQGSIWYKCTSATTT